MKTFYHPAMTALGGLVLGASAMWIWPQEPLQAGTANGNDKFSMVTVPCTGIADTEAVFVLDHLTGILRGAVINNQTGRFTHQYYQIVASDFPEQRNAGKPEYAMVSGQAQFAGGNPSPALGAIYIAEKSSGRVVAYGYSQPRGRGSATPMEMVRIAGFNFAERVE